MGLILLNVLYGLIGCAVGSFLNVVIDRVPEAESLLSPPSECPWCGRRLSPAELIPVVSFLVLRGRCRTCGAAIPLRLLLVELASGALFGFLWWRYGPGISLVWITVYSCVLLVLLVIDLEQRIVPNIIVLPATALALVLVPLRGLALPPVYSHYAFLQLFVGPALALNPGALAVLSQLLGGALAFGIFFLIWLVAPAGMGAGDVKLAALAGLLTAFPGAIAAVFGSFLLGGAVSAVLLLSGAAGRKTAIPFAPFLVITTFVVMVNGDVLLRWYIAYLLG
ncbi:MAG: prepilin peptidase [Chloroflexi bacterium]|nr:prepilin peptidase [Chloroflexota bacterium]